MPDSVFLLVAVAVFLVLAATDWKIVPPRPLPRINEICRRIKRLR
jgi:hypothetical protein